MTIPTAPRRERPGLPILAFVLRRLAVASVLAAIAASALLLSSDTTAAVTAFGAGVGGGILLLLAAAAATRSALPSSDDHRPSFDESARGASTEWLGSGWVIDTVMLAIALIILVAAGDPISALQALLLATTWAGVSAGAVVSIRRGNITARLIPLATGIVFVFLTSTAAQALTQEEPFGELLGIAVVYALVPALISALFHAYRRAGARPQIAVG